MRSRKAGALRSEAAAQFIFGVAGLACFALGCSSDAQPEQAAPSAKTWVGEVRGTDVKVALAQRGQALALFFCGGDDSYTLSTRWFNEGALLTAPFSFTDGGWNVTGAIDAGTF